MRTPQEIKLEQRLRRLINERFKRDAPMGADAFAMIDDIDVTIQQMQRNLTWR